MSIPIGSDPVDAIYIGSGSVDKVYVGSDLVWPVAREYSDNFNRANANNLGPNWTTHVGQISISSNVATSGSPPSYATYNLPLSTDNMEVSAKIINVSGGLIGCRFILGANLSNATAVVAEVRQNTTGASTINTQTGSWGSLTQRSSATLTITAGATYTFRRTGNLYQILQNGSPTALSWQDTGNVHPRNSSHRHVGFGAGLVLYGLPLATNVDDWSAKDIT